MKSLFVSILVLVLGMPSQAQVRVVGPTQSPPHKLVRLSLEGEMNSAVWFPTPLGVGDGEAIGEKGERFVFAAPPGRYDLLIVFTTNGKLGQSSHTVTIGADPGPTPPPPGPTPIPPGPTPGPTPPPAPVLVGRAHLSYVLPDFPTPSQAALRVDPGLRSELAALDAGWRSYLRSEEDLDRLRLRSVIDNAVAGGAPLPLIVVQDAAGRVVSILGESTARGVVDHVKKLRGR
jgi:hypothetical protein